MIIFKNRRRTNITKNSKEILAINLKFYRFELNLTQEQFAEKMDISLTYERELEQFRRNVSIDMLDKLASKLSLQLKYTIKSADLLTYDENKIINSLRVDRRSN